MSCNGQCALRATVLQSLIRLAPPRPLPKCEMRETCGVCTCEGKSERQAQRGDLPVSSRISVFVFVSQLSSCPVDFLQHAV